MPRRAWIVAWMAVALLVGLALAALGDAPYRAPPAHADDLAWQTGAAAGRVVGAWVAGVLVTLPVVAPVLLARWVRDRWRRRRAAIGAGRTPDAPGAA